MLRIAHSSASFSGFSSRDYFSLSSLKQCLGWKRLGSNVKIMVQTNAYFEDLDKSHDLEGDEKLETN